MIHSRAFFSWMGTTCRQTTFRNVLPSDEAARSSKANKNQPGARLPCYLTPTPPSPSLVSPERPHKNLRDVAPPEFPEVPATRGSAFACCPSLLLTKFVVRHTPPSPTAPAAARHPALPPPPLAEAFRPVDSEAQTGGKGEEMGRDLVGRGFRVHLQPPTQEGKQLDHRPRGRDARMVGQKRTFFRLSRDELTRDFLENSLPPGLSCSDVLARR